MRGDAEAKASVHAAVALGALALLGEAQPLLLLGRPLAEHRRRDREDGEAAFVPGLPLALLVLFGARVVADDLRRPEPPRTPAIATTLRRGLNTTELLYVKPPCPSAHTSYSRYSSNAVFFTRMYQL